MIGGAPEVPNVSNKREQREPFVSLVDVAVVGLLIALIVSARFRLLSFFFGDS